MGERLWVIDDPVELKRLTDQARPPKRRLLPTCALYRGTSLIRKRLPVGPYNRPMHMALWWSWGWGGGSCERGTPVCNPHRGLGERLWVIDDPVEPKRLTDQARLPKPRTVDLRLPGKGNSNSHGARPVHLIITMIEWIRTSRLSMKNSLPDRRPLRAQAPHGPGSISETT